MKVLHVIPSVSERSGGPAHAIAPMCQSLQEQGIEVILVTTDAGVESRNSKLETENYKGVPTIFFPSQWGESFKYSRPLAVWLNANVREFDVVHIHAVFNHACIAAANACRRNNIPYIVRPLGTLDPWSMKQKPLRKGMFWRLAGKRLLKGAATVHYTSSIEQQSVEHSLGLNHGKIIPLAVEKDLFKTASHSDLFVRRFPALRGRQYVLMLSRLLPTKGVDVLLDAFLLLRQRQEFANWGLVLAGDGPLDYVDRLKQAATNAEGFVIFPGWLEGEVKVSALRQAALLSLPSYHENFGLCVIEALACGVPVLVSPYVNLAREIEECGAGWVSSVEENSMESTLAEALGSENERTQRGRAGRALARRFNWSAVANQLSTLYCQVISRREREVNSRA